MPTCVGPCWDYYSLTAVGNHCLGEYKLDTRLRRLFRRNDVVPLTPKAFDTCLHNSRNNRCWRMRSFGLPLPCASSQAPHRDLNGRSRRDLIDDSSRRSRDMPSARTLRTRSPVSHQPNGRHLRPVKLTVQARTATVEQNYPDGRIFSEYTSGAMLTLNTITQALATVYSGFTKTFP